MKGKIYDEVFTRAEVDAKYTVLRDDPPFLIILDRAKRLATVKKVGENFTGLIYDKNIRNILEPGELEKV